MLPNSIILGLIRNIESGRPSQYARRIRHAIDRARRFVSNTPEHIVKVPLMTAEERAVVETYKGVPL